MHNDLRNHYVVQHRDVTKTFYHSPYKWEVNTVDDLNTIEGIISEDIYCTAYVIDDNACYTLVSIDPLKWDSTRGVKGPTGILGRQGTLGLPGERGENGAEGVQGPLGNPAPATISPRGAPGSRGAEGDVGPIGFAGERGDDNTVVGPLGKPGDVDEEDSIGSPGPVGVKGSKGEPGEIGETGEKGETGPIQEPDERNANTTVGDEGDPGKKGSLGPILETIPGDLGLPGKTGGPGPLGPVGITGPEGPRGDYSVELREYIDQLTNAGVPPFDAEGNFIYPEQLSTVSYHLSREDTLRHISNPGGVYLSPNVEVSFRDFRRIPGGTVNKIAYSSTKNTSIVYDGQLIANPATGLNRNQVSYHTYNSSKNVNVVNTTNYGKEAINSEAGDYRARSLYSINSSEDIDVLSVTTSGNILHDNMHLHINTSKDVDIDYKLGGNLSDNNSVINNSILLISSSKNINVSVDYTDLDTTDDGDPYSFFLNTKINIACCNDLDYSTDTFLGRHIEITSTTLTRIIGNVNIATSENCFAIPNKHVMSSEENIPCISIASSRNVFYDSDNLPSTNDIDQNNINYFFSAWGYSSGSTASKDNTTVVIDSVSGEVSSSGHKGAGADYAEYFENAETGKLPLGTIVTLKGDKVEPADKGDFLLGVVSATAIYAGNSSGYVWSGRYVKGDFGEPVYDEDGDLKISDDYDDDAKYVPRYKRKDEWTLVGLMGQVHVRVYEDITTRYVSEDGRNSEDKTNLTLMKMLSKYDSKKGYGVALCTIY